MHRQTTTILAGAATLGLATSAWAAAGHSRAAGLATR